LYSRHIIAIYVPGSLTPFLDDCWREGTLEGVLDCIIDTIRAVTIDAYAVISEVTMVLPPGIQARFFGQRGLHGKSCCRHCSRPDYF
jgi:hypothetical protein